MLTKQEVAIVLMLPAYGVSKNFYVAIEGKDFPDVRKKLYDLGWERSTADIQTEHYTEFHMYPPRGTELFGGHTPYEKGKYKKQFKKVLEECGINQYYTQQFDWRNMF